MLVPILALFIAGFAVYIVLTAKPTSLIEARREFSKIARWPVGSPRVTSGFGPRRWPLNPAENDYHGGLDFGAPAGSPVYATADGWVEFAGVTTLDCRKVPGSWRWGYGIAVALNHGSFTSVYLHLSAIEPDLSKGKLILAGAKIGEVGSTGCSTAPHLHFGLGWNRNRVHAFDPFAGWAEGDARYGSGGRNGYWIDPLPVLDGSAQQA